LIYKKDDQSSIGPLRAQNRLAAVQQIEFELNSRSSQSRYAEKSTISAGWLNDLTFGGLNQSSEEIGGNDGSEPNLTSVEGQAECPLKAFSTCRRVNENQRVF